MDETTKGIIDGISRRYDKAHPLPSGRTGKIFFDCIQLSPNDLARLAAEATGHLPEKSFDLVVGCAYRGILFAAAVAGGRRVVIYTTEGKFDGPELKGQRVLVVDDVVVSGDHLKKAARAAQDYGAEVVGFASIVDRSFGKFGSPAQPLYAAFISEE